MCLVPREPIAETADTTDLVLEIVDDLSAALVNTRIYQHDHPRVRTSVDAVARFISEFPAASDGTALRLSVADDVLVYDERPLVGASMTASRLIHGLSRRGAGGIEFAADTSHAAIAAALVEIGARTGDGNDWSSINERLSSAGHGGVRLLPPFVPTDDSGARAPRSILSMPMRFYQSCVDLLQDVTVAVCHGGHIDFGPVQAHAEAVLHQLGNGESRLMNLARQDQYDAFTFGHSVRVGVLAMNFARALTDDQHLLIRIGTAALLHDCGKALVPFEILHSREALGEDERREMARHPQFGAEILLDHEAADPLSIASAFGHHRSTDGGGYPKTEGEHHNLLVTEIVKICDVYEALTAARPYKRPMSPVRAYRVMTSMGSHLDRGLLRRFIGVNGLYPIGQVVLLSTGERARVIAQTEDLNAPIVNLITDLDGNLLDAVDERTVDLQTPSDDALRMILTAVDERASRSPV